MKQDTTVTNNETPIALRSIRVVSKEMGVSYVTLWRWKNKGWFKTVNINGKTFIDIHSWKEFERRAALGEFYQEHHGAAHESVRAKKERQEQDAQ